ncbi:MAG TPA: DUF308 domain-containing protein [Marmoricola sp.]|nr:DUF308 domain-containing protein [Marmoricola sp.]
MTTTHVAPPVTGTPDPETRALPPAAYVITGLATLALGIIVLLWPDTTLVVVAVLFGVQIILSGILQLVGAWHSPATPGVRALLGVLGLAALALGVMLVLHPFTSLGVLVLLVALGWLAQAVADLMAGARAQGGRRWGLWALALVAVAGAVVLLVWPELTLLVMVRIAGWTLVVVGLLEIISVFVHRARHA